MGNRLFLSYARPDSSSAQRLADQLSNQGLSVWLDRDKLLPGQRWRDEIQNAIRNTDYVLVLLSTKSVSRRGFVQSEIASALDVLKEIPPDEVFIIPARLDDCDVKHPQLLDLQWVDLFPDWDAGVRRIALATGLTSGTDTGPHDALRRFRGYLAGQSDVPSSVTNWAKQVDEELFLVTCSLSQTQGRYVGPTRDSISKFAQPLGVGRSVQQVIEDLHRFGILAPSSEEIRPGTYAEIDARRNPSYDFGRMFREVSRYLRDGGFLDDA